MEGMLTTREKHSFSMDSNDPQHVPGSGDHSKLGSNEAPAGEQSQALLGDLPEVCLATILSHLPPREVAKLASVCRSFRDASSFDSVWERMLPPSYKDILSRGSDVAPLHFASKRAIFDHFRKPVLKCNDTQGVWVDVETGGFCLSVAARGLHITWGDDNRYWDWVHDPKSLFPEVALLKTVCWFEAKGEVECSLPAGAYTLSWRMGIADVSGFHSEPACFTFSKSSSRATEAESHQCKCFIDPRPYGPRMLEEQFPQPTVRAGDAGWTEYDVGEFVVDEGEQACFLRFSVSAVESGGWKSGLCLDGVVVRPTSVVTRTGGAVGSPPAESGFHTPEFQPEGSEFQITNSIRRFFTSLPPFRRHW